MDALHFRPEWFDKIPSISLVKSDEKIHLENPAPLPRHPCCCQTAPPFPNSSKSSPSLQPDFYPYIDETVRFC